MSETKNQPDQVPERTTSEDPLRAALNGPFPSGGERTEIEVYSQIQEEGLFGQRRRRTESEGTDESGDEPCDICGQQRKLHGLKRTGSYFYCGVENPIFAIVCPEPIPTDDAEGRDS